MVGRTWGQFCAEPNRVQDQAEAMLQWPHSGFHVHTGVGVGEDERPSTLRLARYCARNPLALDRLTYDPAAEQLTYRSDKADGPTAGTAALDPLESLARLLTHILAHRARVLERPRPPTSGLGNALTPRPNPQTGTKEVPIHWP